MAEERKYYIYVPGELVEVSGGVYYGYHQDERHAKTLEEKDRRHGLVQYSSLDTAELTGEESLPDRDAVSVEDAAIANVLREELYRYLALLSREDQELIHALYFEELSEHKFSKMTHIPQQTISDRKKRVLVQLRKFFEK